EKLAENLRGLLRVEPLKIKTFRTAPAPVKGSPAGSAAGEAAGGAGKAKAVVLGTFALVAEDVIGVLHLLEARLGLLVAGVAVGVVLPRQLAVRLLDFVFAGVPFDAQCFVIIAG